jgi:phage-related protein
MALDGLVDEAKLNKRTRERYRESLLVRQKSQSELKDKDLTNYKGFTSATFAIDADITQTEKDLKDTMHKVRSTNSTVGTLLQETKKEIRGKILNFTNIAKLPVLQSHVRSFVVEMLLKIETIQWGYMYKFQTAFDLRKRNGSAGNPNGRDILENMVNFICHSFDDDYNNLKYSKSFLAWKAEDILNTTKYSKKYYPMKVILEHKSEIKNSFNGTVTAMEKLYEDVTSYIEACRPLLSNISLMDPKTFWQARELIGGKLEQLYQSCADLSNHVLETIEVIKTVSAVLQNGLNEYETSYKNFGTHYSKLKNLGNEVAQSYKDVIRTADITALADDTEALVNDWDSVNKLDFVNVFAYHNASGLILYHAKRIANIDRVFEVMTADTRQVKEAMSQLNTVMESVYSNLDTSTNRSSPTVLLDGVHALEGLLNQFKRLPEKLTIYYEHFHELNQHLKQFNDSLEIGEDFVR